VWNYEVVHHIQTADRVFNMTLTETHYEDHSMKIWLLCCDIRNIQVPNAFCEKELIKVKSALVELLTQLKTHNNDSFGNSLNGERRWWCPEVVPNKHDKQGFTISRRESK